MKAFRFLLIAVICSLCLPLDNARAADGPSIYKPGIVMNVQRFPRYFPTPTAKEPIYRTTCWVPRFWFMLAGPVAGGTQMTIGFTKPDGSAWLTLPLVTPELADGATQTISSPAIDERKAILATGTFGFTISYSNELTGAKGTLYTGKFTVGKFRIGTAPDEQNVNEYYVDHDWLLPIGYYYYDYRIDKEAPRLRLSLYFRGESKMEDLAGYVFYKGKQISSTKIEEQGGVYNTFSLLTPGNLPDPRWETWTFSFNNVAATHPEEGPTHYADYFHFLDKNPGDYEIKILKGGKLARSAKFSVGADGKMVDNGLNAKNGVTGFWWLIPVTVTPGLDGKANPADYKTKAFYNNGVVGFP